MAWALLKYNNLLNTTCNKDRVEQINSNYARCAEYLPCPSDLPSTLSWVMRSWQHALFCFFLWASDFSSCLPNGNHQCRSIRGREWNSRHPSLSPLGGCIPGWKARAFLQRDFSTHLPLPLLPSRLRVLEF